MPERLVHPADCEIVRKAKYNGSGEFLPGGEDDFLIRSEDGTIIFELPSSLGAADDAFFDVLSYINHAYSLGVQYGERKVQHQIRQYLGISEEMDRHIVEHERAEHNIREDER